MLNHRDLKQQQQENKHHTTKTIHKCSGMLSINYLEGKRKTKQPHKQKEFISRLEIPMALSLEHLTDSTLNCLNKWNWYILVLLILFYDAHLCIISVHMNHTTHVSTYRFSAHQRKSWAFRTLINQSLQVLI